MGAGFEVRLILIEGTNSFSHALSESSSVGLEFSEQFFFLFRDVDVSVLQRVHLNIDVGYISELTLELLENGRNQINLSEWNLVYHFLVGRISVLSDSCLLVVLR